MAGSAVTTIKSGTKRGLVRVDIDFTCASGVVSRQPVGEFYGRLVGVLLDPTAGAGATMTTTADLLLSDEHGASIISDLSFAGAQSYRPTAIVRDNTGTAVTASTSAPNVNRDIYVSGTLYAAIANATTTDTGRCSLLILEGED